MLIARRSSTRQAADVPVGSRVVARPPSARPITGVVIGVEHPYTVIVDSGAVIVAVDVEDLDPPGGPVREAWAAGAVKAASRAAAASAR